MIIDVLLLLLLLKRLKIVSRRSSLIFCAAARQIPLQNLAGLFWSILVSQSHFLAPYYCCISTSYMHPYYGLNVVTLRLYLSPNTFDDKHQWLSYLAAFVCYLRYDL